MDNSPQNDDTRFDDYLSPKHDDYLPSGNDDYLPTGDDDPARANAGSLITLLDMTEMQAAAEKLAGAALHNPITLLLQDQRKETTRRGYRLSLSAFFKYLGFGPNPSPAVVHAFVSQEPHHIALQLAGYRAHMLEQKLSSSTINTRMAPIRSLLAFSLRLGFSKTNGRDLVRNEKVRVYRDTRGPLAETVDRILQLPDRQALKGKRDYAILRLLCDNGMRRAEVWALTVEDFDVIERRIKILGKGHSDKEWIELAPGTARAVHEYLTAARHTDGPLFRSCDRRPGAADNGLTRDGLHDMIVAYGNKLGIKLTPHKFRHYAISWLAVKTNGNIPLIMQFSRHARYDTVQKYVDAIQNQQGALSRMLADRHDD